MKEMRLFTLLLLFMLSCLPKLCAQENLVRQTILIDSGLTIQKHAILIDIFPVIEGYFEGNSGFGVFYEHRLKKFFSNVIEFNYYTNFQKNNSFSLIEHARAYPFMSAINKLFIDIGAGYRKSKWDTDDIHCIIGSLGVGWKFIFKKNIVLEPSFGFWHNLYTISGHTDHNYAQTFGVGIGFIY